MSAVSKAVSNQVRRLHRIMIVHSCIEVRFALQCKSRLRARKPGARGGFPAGEGSALSGETSPAIIL
jgi:hypothetical protein